MASRCPISSFKALLCVAMALVGSGCSEAVVLTHETETGGVVAYLFKEERGGAMGSPHRREALQMIERKCPTGYTLINNRTSSVGIPGKTTLKSGPAVCPMTT